MTPPAAAAAPAVRRAAHRGAAPATRRCRVRGASPGPPAPRQPAAPVEHGAQPSAALAVGLLAALDGLPRHRLLDRLIARADWIALVAFALIGIVTLQLLLLTLNGDIGRALEREALLQRENAALSIENSELAARRTRRGAGRASSACSSCRPARCASSADALPACSDARPRP